MRPEDRLRAHCRQYLNAHFPDLEWTAIEHGRLHKGTEEERAREWGRLAAQGVKRGIEDIQIVQPRTGRHVAFEAKWGTNSQSEHQKRRQKALEANGALYFVGRSVAALADVLMEIGVDVSRTKLMLAVQHDELIEREIAAAPVKKARRSSPRAPKPRADAARIAATHRAQAKGTFSG